MSKFFEIYCTFLCYLYDRVCSWTGSAAILWGKNSYYGFFR